MNKLAKSLLVVALLSGGAVSAAIQDVVQHFVRNAHLFCEFALLNVSIFHFFFDDFTWVNRALAYIFTHVFIVYSGLAIPICYKYKP